MTIRIDIHTSPVETLRSAIRRGELASATEAEKRALIDALAALEDEAQIEDAASALAQHFGVEVDVEDTESWTALLFALAARQIYPDIEVELEDLGSTLCTSVKVEVTRHNAALYGFEPRYISVEGDALTYDSRGLETWASGGEPQVWTTGSTAEEVTQWLALLSTIRQDRATPEPVALEQPSEGPEPEPYTLENLVRDLWSWEIDFTLEHEGTDRARVRIGPLDIWCDRQMETPGLVYVQTDEHGREVDDGEIESDTDAYALLLREGLT